MGCRAARSVICPSRPTARPIFRKQAVWGWRQLPVPVIAAIHGVAFGGGFQLALGADMRFLSPDARMSIMEIKWGLVPDMAGTPILASLVARRYPARAYLYRPHLLGARRPELRPRHPGLRRSACRGTRGRARDRRQEPGCDPCRQAAAEQSVGRSSGRRCSRNPSSSRNCSAARTRPKPCAPIWRSARREFADA